MSTRKGTKGFLFGALAGGIVGSITALLLAPKPGKELREDIVVSAQKVGETTGNIAKGIGGQAKQAADNMAAAVRGFRKTDAVDEGSAIATIAGISDETGQELASEAFDQAIDNETIADTKEHL